MFLKKQGHTYLSLKAVRLIHIVRLMIAAREEEMLRIHKLVREKRQNTLDGKGSAIDKIAVKQKGIARRRLSRHGEDVEQIVKLPVNIAANRQMLLGRYCDVDDGRLLLVQLLDFEQNLSENKAKFSNHEIYIVFHYSPDPEIPFKGILSYSGAAPFT